MSELYKCAICGHMVSGLAHCCDPPPSRLAQLIDCLRYRPSAVIAAQMREAADELERLTQERAGFAVIVGEISALLPLAETVSATATGATMIAWFKACIAERDRMREALERHGDLCAELARYFDSGIIRKNTDLWLLLQECDKLRAPVTSGESHG